MSLRFDFKCKNCGHEWYYFLGYGAQLLDAHLGNPVKTEWDVLEENRKCPKCGSTDRTADWDFARA